MSLQERFARKIYKHYNSIRTVRVFADFDKAHYRSYCPHGIWLREFADKWKRPLCALSTGGSFHQFTSAWQIRDFFFYVYIYIIIFLVPITIIVWMFFFRLPNSGFGYNNCMFVGLLTSKYDLRQLFGGAR